MISLFSCKGPTHAAFYSLSLHDALPIWPRATKIPSLRSSSRCHASSPRGTTWGCSSGPKPPRSEEHTSELQSRGHLVCRLLLEKKNNYKKHLLSKDGFHNNFPVIINVSD